MKGCQSFLEKGRFSVMALLFSAATTFCLCPVHGADLASLDELDRLDAQA